MLSCKEVSRLLSESQDRTLSIGKKLGLRIHLLMCGACGNFKRQLDILRRMICIHIEISSENGVEPVNLTPDARERIRKSLLS